MKTTDKLKISVFEAMTENLIEKDLGEEMLNFCESANLDDLDDLKMAMDIVDTLIAVSERVETVEEPKESPTRDEIALSIFESEAAGEITAEEREILFGLLDN